MSATFIGSSNAQMAFGAFTTATFATPSSVVAGDTLIVVITGDVSAQVATLPSGWTKISEDVSPDGGVVDVWARTVGDSEPTTHVVTFVDVAPASAGMLAFADLDPASIVTQPVADYLSPTTHMLTPPALVTSTLQYYLGITYTTIAATTLTPPPGSDVLINLSVASDGTARQLLIFSLPVIALGTIPQQLVTLATARSGISSTVLLLGLKTAELVPFPVSGDAAYRDHLAEMLARLPERFRRKKVV